MIPRQPLALQSRSSSHHMISLRYGILVVTVLIHALWTIKSKTGPAIIATTTAFHLNDSACKYPIRRNFDHRMDTAFMTTTSTIIRQSMRPNSIRANDHIFSLNMAKNRVGLEQKRETATPTGANDANHIYY